MSNVNAVAQSLSFGKDFANATNELNNFKYGNVVSLLLEKCFTEELAQTQASDDALASGSDFSSFVSKK